jgi:hypothetical protein
MDTHFDRGSVKKEDADTAAPVSPFEMNVTRQSVVRNGIRTMLVGLLASAFPQLTQAQIPATDAHPLAGFVKGLTGETLRGKVKAFKETTSVVDACTSADNVLQACLLYTAPSPRD